MDAQLDSLTRRIAARRWAEDAVEAAEDRRAFAERVAELAGFKLASSVPSSQPAKEAMTNSQSVMFENHTTMPYGQHVGKLVKDVELDYLVWLAENTDEFKRELRRYLKAPRIQEELNATE